MAPRQISFGTFRAYHGSPDKLSPSTFVLLDEPMEIVVYLGGQMHVFALAWTNSREAELEGYTYALGIRPTVRGYELWVTRVAGDPVNRMWPGDMNYVHRDWVKAWIQSHPQELALGAMMVGRELGRHDYKLVELEIITESHTGDIPSSVAKASRVDPKGMQAGDYHFQLVTFAHKVNVETYSRNDLTTDARVDFVDTKYTMPSGLHFIHSELTMLDVDGRHIKTLKVIKVDQ